MTPNTEQKLTGTVREAAEAAGLGINQAYAACENGDIPAMRVGKRWIVKWPAFIRKFSGIEQAA